MEDHDSVRTLVRVVLVEDDPLLLCSFADSLRELGYDVRETTDPAEALGWIERDGADALFTDINMPGMDGRDLAVKARHSTPKLRIVFATGYSVAKVPDLAHARYLRKPFAPEDMQKALEGARVPIGTV